ncbi:RCC1 domain-containing protein 1 isoform X1 [Drosophila guanche]|uniref:Blast:RCC1 domain-containing protein 1 n=1 Tax=Drosophila guanche TaxID=7266 RepID=A0A3B0JL36_DROGU|nr:RCC1 domain-containing protein 1 isoform X1 [Drosophila guanche]SPP82935.1 blast:RCC1 domain-containing protein 1 [Drosophila guanche]
MRQLLFTGFNAFGQHEFVNSPHDECAASAGFREISAHDRGNNNTKNQCTISFAWRYTAYALGRKLSLRGLLETEPGECVEVEAPGEIKALAAGDSHCLVLLCTGELYKIQPKLEATLQAIRLENPPRPSTATKRTIFGAVKASAPPSIEHIACGTNINVAVNSENAVYSIPSCLHQFPDRQWRVQQLECGHEHALLLNGNGDVYTWGNGLRGQLGQVALCVEETPQLIESLAGIKITGIAAGGWHSAAISAFGDLYTWGLNCSGQLGMRVMKPNGLQKEPTVYPLPQLHDLPDCCCCSSKESGAKDTDVCEPLKVFAGSRHTLLIRRCGRLWASGWCIHGQLGKQLCEQNFLDAFQALHRFGADPDVVNVLCGPWATLLMVRQKESVSTDDPISSRC